MADQQATSTLSDAEAFALLAEVSEEPQAAQDDRAPEVIHREAVMELGNQLRQACRAVDQGKVSGHRGLAKVVTEIGQHVAALVQLDRAVTGNRPKGSSKTA